MCVLLITISKQLAIYWTSVLIQCVNTMCLLILQVHSHEYDNEVIAPCKANSITL